MRLSLVHSGERLYRGETLFGVDCHTPIEAALIPSHVVEATEVVDYREELVLYLSTARRLAAESIQAAQMRYIQSII